MCLFSCSLQPNCELLTVNFSNQRRDMSQFWYSFELPSTVLTVIFLKERRNMCRFWYPLEPALKVLTVNFFHKRRDMCLFWFCQRHVENFQSAPESSQSPPEAYRVLSKATRVLPKSSRPDASRVLPEISTMLANSNFAVGLRFCDTKTHISIRIVHITTCLCQNKSMNIHKTHFMVQNAGFG